MTAVGGLATTVQAAVDRALAKQRADATREVESILDAALRVAERVAPAAPRVADIVAEAGTSNQAFYRYFAGKDDLMKAVFERGITRLYTYLEHQIGKESEPAKQVEAWIRGVLTQVTDRTAARQSAAIIRQLSQHSDVDEAGLLAAVGGLLVGPVARAGSTSRSATPPDRRGGVRSDAPACPPSTAPSAADCDHIVGFCLRGLTRAH